MAAVATTSTARAALGSILGTINSTATSISAIVNTAGKSVGMLDAFVSKASEQQVIKQKVAREDFVNDLIRTCAETQTMANMAVVEFCSKSSAHAEQYATAYDRYSNLLAEYRPDAAPAN